MDAPRLYSTVQAAEALGISPRTLELYRHTGNGPVYVKLGSRTVYAPEDLATWVEARKRRSTKEGKTGT
ncbi:MAG TPA: helix-turn-helix domain-containing protein [Thermoanaerobaculia bacterium]|jgi:DNA-binding transcriptional MerR regulator